MSTSPHSFPIVNILGLPVAALNPDTALECVNRWIADHEAPCRFVCLTNVNVATQAQQQPAVRAMLNRADACLPDGMPLAWLGRLQGHHAMRRVYGPDLMLAVLEHGIDHATAHYFYGGAEGVAEELAQRMTARLPGLRVAGTGCPPFRPLTDTEVAEAAAEINASGAEVVWVGISSPKQDLLMERMAPLLTGTRVMFGVGAAFDFHTGRVKQAPRWMMNAGLEWAFRLLAEPRRLWRRYLIRNPLFILHCILQRSGIRKYPLD